MVARVRVLVVEDNADAAGCLVLLLNLFGCDVRAVNEGQAAIAEVVVFKPELMLVDLAMPGMDGFAVARRVRQHADLRRTPLVAVTGYADQRHRRLSLEAGFDDYLVKPVAAERFVELVERVRAGDRQFDASNA